MVKRYCVSEDNKEGDVLALQFILGSAGSGKSTYVMNTVAEQLKQNNRKKIILMVPEQATFCYQYELITRYGLQGICTLEILSFQRLAKTVMQSTGGLARQNLDDLGKLLVLRNVLLEAGDKAPYLSQSVNRPGYLAKLGDTIQELKRYQIDADGLQTIVAQNTLPKTLFSNKLEELSMLYSGYQTFLSQAYMDSEDMLDLLLKQLDDTDLFRDTEIWVDEFYDFTPQEFAVLEKLMQCASQVHIVLPIDTNHNNPGRNAVFYHIGQSLTRLREAAVQHQITMLPDVICSAPLRWQNQQDLTFLEQHYFSTGMRKYESLPNHIMLTQGQNRLSEVDYVARTIRKLCREEQYRYSDIGIFTRGEQYQLQLETTLSDYDIPHFIDHKEPVQQHPLTELLLAAFETVQTHWSYQSVFRFLKCGLLPFAQDEIDLLENYVLQYGIKGSVWYKPEPWLYGREVFSKNQEEETLERLDVLRRKIANPLYSFACSIEGEQDAKTIISALYTLLEAYEVPQQLSGLCEAALQQNLLDVAQVHQQIWDKLIHIFDQMGQLLHDTKLTAESFATILLSAVQNLDLGLLPSSLDQVFVGALAHSRARNLKVVFVLGLNEGVFPAKGSQDGFFNDMEKHMLRDLGVVLSPDSKEQIYDEQFLIYLAFTRASEQLFLSYSLSDEEGKALRPSSIVEKLRQIFPTLSTHAVQWPPDTSTDQLLLYFNHQYKTLGLLGSHLSHDTRCEDETIWTDLYHWFENHGDSKFCSVRQSVLHETMLEEKMLTHTALFGSPLYLSVSALEKYRQCPYGYFLRYGLRLKERKLYQIEAVDTGQFYHAAIEQFSQYLLDNQISWQAITADEVKTIMAQIVEALAPQMQHEILMSTGRYQYVRHRLQKTLERSALLLMEHGQKGAFVPVALEADFGTAKSKLPGWKLTLQDGTELVLQGRIDRIEQAKADEVTYLRVIDFKSGKQGLDFTEIFYGLKIQLLTYLHVALEYYRSLLPDSELLLPAGVLYFS